jgi:hypothetical protein
MRERQLSGCSSTSMVGFGSESGGIPSGGYGLVYPIPRNSNWVGMGGVWELLRVY